MTSGMGTHMTVIDVGARLAEIRESAGLTQDQLAEQSGVSRKHISAIETGATNPTVDLLGALLKCCNSTLAEFFQSRLVRRYQDPDHERSHEKLQALLEAKDKKLAPTAKTLIDALYGQLRGK